MLWLLRCFITFLFSFMGMMGTLKKGEWEMTLLHNNHLLLTLLLVNIKHPIHRITVLLVSSASLLTSVETGLERAVSHIQGYSWECRPQGWTLCFEIHWSYLCTLELWESGTRELSFLQIWNLRYSRLWLHLFLCHLGVCNPTRWEYILHFIFNLQNHYVYLTTLIC